MLTVEKAQAAYCETRDRADRKAAGQFFTPRWIASGMASWVVACQPAYIIDPAVGFGILLDECRRHGYSGKLLGCDIDPVIVEEWTQGLGGDLNAEIRHQDFLEMPFAPIAAAIVNPPYNRFQNRALSETLRAEISQVVGLAASGYTNQYALFMYLVVSRLNAGGRAAFIVPSEFLATGYGEQVKAFICRNRRLSRIVLFDTADRIFPDAATTACVMLFEGAPCENLQVWHLPGELEARQFQAICAGQDMPPPHACIDYDQLDPQSNWQGLGQGNHSNDGMVVLTAFGDVKRGIATGGNEFFVLRPSEVESRSLATVNLVNCIAGANSAPSLIFDDAQFNRLHAQDKPCYLFNGLSEENESAQRYVIYGENIGINQRYLTRMRNPWYRLESRRPAPLLLAVFGREGFRVCFNRTQAVNLTAFHGFYPHPGMEKWVPLIWLYFQSPMARERYITRQRAYGDGLKKLEPGDWSKLHVPDWRRWREEQQICALELAARVLMQSNSDDQPELQEACVELERLISTAEVVGDISSIGMSQINLL